MTQGVYAIIHRSSGLRYIGSSCQIEERFTEHRRKLRRNIHHARRLQNAWNKYGDTAFDFVVVEVIADRLHLYEREQAHIDALKELFNGSRIARVPEPRRGIPLTPEHRSKLSRALQGRVFTVATRAKISAKATGRVLSVTARTAIGASKIGRRNPRLARNVTSAQIAKFRSNVAAIFNDPIRKAAWIESNRQSHAGRPWSVARRAAHERMKADPSTIWTNQGRRWTDQHRSNHAASIARRTKQVGKLTRDQRAEIRRLSGQLSQRNIARRYGVTQRAVWEVIHKAEAGI